MEVVCSYFVGLYYFPIKPWDSLVTSHPGTDLVLSYLIWGNESRLADCYQPLHLWVESADWIHQLVDWQVTLNWWIQKSVKKISVDSGHVCGRQLRNMFTLKVYGFFALWSTFVSLKYVLTFDKPVLISHLVGPSWKVSFHSEILKYFWYWFQVIVYRNYVFNELGMDKLIFSQLT